MISHTSRGLEDRSAGTIIKKGLSITPASILTALDAVNDTGIDFDVFIAEVSIGGTGCTDIGIITTIANDYKIANNTKLASDAKRRMILDARPGTKLVVNNDASRFFGACRRDIEVIYFTDSVNASCNVYYENLDKKGGTIAYFLGKEQGKIHIREADDYDITSYKTAFVCATAAALSLDIQSGSGSIKRCPECNRQVKNGMCGEHGKVEGIYDLRTKAVLDNGSEIRELLLDAERPIR